MSKRRIGRADSNLSSRMELEDSPVRHSDFHYGSSVYSDSNPDRELTTTSKRTNHVQTPQTHFNSQSKPQSTTRVEQPSGNVMSIFSTTRTNSSIGAPWWQLLHL